MSHAELCPVCRGAGKVENKGWQESSRLVNNELVCHGCQGLGWVTIYDGEYEFGYSGGTEKAVTNYTKS